MARPAASIIARHNAAAAFGRKMRGDMTKSDVTMRIKKAKARLAEAQSRVTELEALRAEMQAAKAATVADLPEPSQAKYQDALPLWGDA